MARDRASGATVSGGRVRKENRGGKKSKLFEDAVIASYFRLSPPEQNDPKLVSKVLGDFLGVPPEVAEVVVAEYDLANSFRSSQALETQLRQQIEEFFPLPPPETSRVLLGSRFIPDTWTRHLSKHSPAKRQFDAWRKGEPSTHRPEGADDGYWWKDILASARAIEFSQKESPSADLNTFIKQEEGRLWQLYGAQVERSQFQNAIGNIGGDLIPGPAITVDSKRHADGWLVEWGTDGRVILKGLVESKASLLGLEKAQHQIRGFLSRLVESPKRIYIFGEAVDPKQIFVRTKNGDQNLIDFATQNKTWIQGSSTVDDSFIGHYNQVFAPSFYQVLVPKTDVELTLPVGQIVLGKASLADVRDAFVALVQKHFLGGYADAAELRDRLFKSNEYTSPKWRAVSDRHFDRRNGPVSISDGFMDPNTGGLLAIRSLPGYSVKTDKAFDSLLGHLPENVQKQIQDDCPVINTDGHSALRGQRKAAERIRKRLENTIKAHNEWAEKDPENRKVISWDGLETKDGMTAAIGILSGTR
jgi:hypothetical protein